MPPRRPRSPRRTGGFGWARVLAWARALAWARVLAWARILATTVGVSVGLVAGTRKMLAPGECRVKVRAECEGLGSECKSSGRLCKASGRVCEVYGRVCKPRS